MSTTLVTVLAAIVVIVWVVYRNAYRKDLPLATPKSDNLEHFTFHEVKIDPVSGATYLVKLETIGDGVVTAQKAAKEEKQFRVSPDTSSY